MIIDAHVHVWDLEYASYPWLDGELDSIRRTFDLGDLKPLLEASEVTSVVLVQAADSAADTSHMLQVAHQERLVSGVVAWVPLDDPPAGAERLAELRQDRLVVGVRALIHDYADPRWILTAEVAPSLRHLEELAIPLDIVTKDQRGLRLVVELSERHPELRMVIDHLGKPPAADGGAAYQEWNRLLAAAARNPLVYAKLSGLGVPPQSLSSERAQTLLAVARREFGAERLMFGSDWPVSILSGGYATTWRAVSTAMDGLPDQEREQIEWRTAADFYRLEIRDDVQLDQS